MPSVAKSSRYSNQHGDKLICKDQANRFFKPTVTMYLITEQDSSNFSLNFFWRYLRSLYLEDVTTSEFLLDLQPPFITSNSPRTRLSLVDRVPTIHCLWSLIFQRTMHFMHRWHFTVKAHVNNIIPPPSLVDLPGRNLPNKVLQSQDNMFCIFLLLSVASNE